MNRYHIIFQGQIQNVGFRLYVKKIAIDHNLTGYVKNLTDFTLVEVEFQGNENQIKDAIKEIIKGNIFIKVIDYKFKLIDNNLIDKEFVIK